MGWTAAIPGLIAARCSGRIRHRNLEPAPEPMISELLPTSVRNTTLALLLNVTRGLQFFTPLAITMFSFTWVVRRNALDWRDSSRPPARR